MAGYALVCFPGVSLTISEAANFSIRFDEHGGKFSKWVNIKKKKKREKNSVRKGEIAVNE